MREYKPFTDAEKMRIQDTIEARFGTLFNQKLVNQFVHVLESATLVEFGFDDLYDCLGFCTEGYEVFYSFSDLKAYAEKNGTKFQMILGYRAYSLEQSSNFPKCFTDDSNSIGSFVTDDGFLATCCSIDEADGEEFFLVSK